MTKIKVRLARSTINSTARQIESVKGLGLRKIGQERTLENTPAVRGMIKKVMHLLDVEEIEGVGHGE